MFSVLKNFWSNSYILYGFSYFRTEIIKIKKNKNSKTTNAEKERIAPEVFEN